MKKKKRNFFEVVELTDEELENVVGGATIPQTCEKLKELMLQLDNPPATEEEWGAYNRIIDSLKKEGIKVARSKGIRLVRDLSRLKDLPYYIHVGGIKDIDW